MASTTFVDKVTTVPTAWLNEVNGTVWTLFGAATTASAGRTALGITPTGDAIVTAPNTAAIISSLGLGTASTQNTGTSGTNVPLLNGTNTWANPQTFSENVTLGGQLQGKYATTSAAATVTLGSIKATYIEITGSTNISSFGTVGAEGLEKLLYFPTAAVAGTTIPVGVTVYPTDIVRVVKTGAEGNDAWQIVSVYRSSTGAGRTIRAGTALSLDPYAVSTTTTQAHGLGVFPTYVDAVLICKTAELNYSIGDTIDLSAFVGYNTADIRSFVLLKDATNLTLITNSLPLYVLNKTTRTAAAITAANWKVLITPYAFLP